MLDLLFWVGALKFRASDNSEVAPSEVFVTMEERGNSFHDESSKLPSCLCKSLRHIHKSPCVNAGQMMGGRAREAGLNSVESIVIHKHETLLGLTRAIITD